MITIRNKLNQTIGEIKIDDGLIQLILAEPKDGKTIIAGGFWDEDLIGFSEEFIRTIGPSGEKVVRAAIQDRRSVREHAAIR